MTEKAIRDFFDTHPAIKINVFERECGVPTDTIYKFLRGRGLPKKHLPAVIDLMKHYGLK